MTRRCSHCSNNGHNSRTCPNRGGVRLFGVKLTDGSIMKKSASMGNLSSHYHSSSSAAASPNPGSPTSDHLREPVHLPDGYLSDDPVHASTSANRRVERKKGVPWTEDEHRLFLLGLQKLGKGDWRGISRNYVVTRTPTQVASHAQKYFIRHSNATRKKRRSSLFDMVSDINIMATDQHSIHEDQQFMLPPTSESEANPETSLTLALNRDIESMETTATITTYEESKESFYPTAAAYLPVPFQLWSSNVSPIEETIPTHRVLRPTPVLRKDAVNVDELVGMSELSLGDSEKMEPSELTLKLLGEPSRQSAFHVSTPSTNSGFQNLALPEFDRHRHLLQLPPLPPCQNPLPPPPPRQHPQLEKWGYNNHHHHHSIPPPPPMYYAPPPPPPPPPASSPPKKKNYCVLKNLPHLTREMA